MDEKFNKEIEILKQQTEILGKESFKTGNTRKKSFSHEIVKK
jgi:hypothetical protein